jgi:hypothetical protein
MTGKKVVVAATAAAIVAGSLAFSVAPASAATAAPKYKPLICGILPFLCPAPAAPAKKTKKK